ncbi:ATP-grasp domain-containing protein [Paenibacillus sp. WLX1005]|uniref:ATP-grasp domain-containing protein n=1 Tax=Paenibacillus sp. WLX1005 TaxID=3243766 RepID=UPI003983E1A7
MITDHDSAQTPRTILLTGGRAPVTLELARLLHQAGHTVDVAESLPQQLCARSKAVRQSFVVPPPRQQPQAYIQELVRIVKQQWIDILVPTCEEIFYVAHGLEQLRQVCEVLVPPATMLQSLHHKGEFIQLVHAAGLDAPDTMVIHNRQQWEKVQHGEWSSLLAASCSVQDLDAASDLPSVYTSRSLVFKPAYSRFASKVIMPAQDMTDDPASAGEQNERSPSAVIAAPDGLSEQEPWIAQAYVPGEQLCTYSIVYEGTIVAHATYQSRYRSSEAGASVHFEALDRPDTLVWVQQLVQQWNKEACSVDPSSVSHQTNNADASIASESPIRTLSARACSGQLSFDLIQERQTGKLYPIECNPRATSGIHLFTAADRLDMAIVAPQLLVEQGQVIMPQPGRRVMLTLPMLTSGWGRRWSGRQWKQWLKAMRGAHDAVFRWQDMMPFFGQFALVLAAVRISRREQITVTQALTHDIEWNGQPLERSDV